MICESTGISLNIASFPVAKKKKSKSLVNTSSSGVISAGPKNSKTVVPKLQKIPAVVPSKEPVSILKNPKAAAAAAPPSIWKKFKTANKKEGCAEPSFVKPVVKPKTLVKKKVKVKGDVEIVPPPEVGFSPEKKLKTSVEKVDKVQNPGKGDVKFLESDISKNNENIILRKPKNQFLDGGTAPKHSKSEHQTGVTTSLFWNNPEIPNIPHRAVKPVEEPVFSKRSFEDLELHPYTVKYLKESMGLTTMTTVQEKSIPVLLKKRDALIKSQTGSGKTLAFALPILHILQEIRPKINRADGVLALIVVPTRELALQVYEVFDKLVKSYTWIVPGYLVGGEKRKSEKARLRKGISILIGTPGRLVDHVQHTKALNLEKVSWLVIDEADRLLDMGYEKDVSTLLDALNKNESCLLRPSYLTPEVAKEAKEAREVEPKQRQTILLSATLTKKVENLAGLSLNDPVFIDACDENGRTPSSVPVFSSDIGKETETMVLPASLVQKYVVTPPKLKFVTLVSFMLRNSKGPKKMLIFIATQDMVDYYSELLSAVFSPTGEDDEDPSPFANSRIELFKLHGNMKQNERTEVFKTFRKSHFGVLLCTDVASRGLDLPQVDWVIQYTGPTSVSDYVHRVGRTARGGQSGSSIIFLTPNEVSFIGKLENCQIRLQEEKMESCLEHLAAMTRSVQEEASNLQKTLEDMVAGKKELHDLGCKAFASWSRFYASYPRSMKDAFNVKAIHQGHCAKSFALRDPPSVIVSFARKRSLNGEERSLRKTPRERAESEKRRKFPGKKLAEMSEYDSGLESPRKRRKMTGCQQGNGCRKTWTDAGGFDESHWISAVEDMLYFD